LVEQRKKMTSSRNHPPFFFRVHHRVRSFFLIRRSCTRFIERCGWCRWSVLYQSKTISCAKVRSGSSSSTLVHPSKLRSSTRLGKDKDDNHQPHHQDDVADDDGDDVLRVSLDLGPDEVQSLSHACGEEGSARWRLFRHHDARASPFEIEQRASRLQQSSPFAIFSLTLTCCHHVMVDF